MVRSLTLAVLASLTLGSLSAAETYELDKVHSVALFKVSHLGISNTWGRFNDVSGSLAWDADLAACALKIAVKIDSIDTADAKRDQHLKQADFFNAKQFPEATFVSKSWKKTGEKTFDVAGDLTIHGTTRAVTVPVTLTGKGDTPFKDHRVGFEGTIAFKRSDFEMKDKLAFAGDEVTLIVAIEAIRK